MSYDIRLNHPDTGATLPTEHFAEGGTRNLYGTNECDLNVTYNYYEVFKMAEFSLQDLHGQNASETLTRLQDVKLALGGFNERPPKPYQPDYWAPTPGNALAVINRLIQWAEEHPTGVWQVT